MRRTPRTSHRKRSLGLFVACGLFAGIRSSVRGSSKLRSTRRERGCAEGRQSGLCLSRIFRVKRCPCLEHSSKIGETCLPTSSNARRFADYSGTPSRCFPITYRRVFLLREVEELNVNDVAQMLNISKTLVNVRLHRARMMLQRRLAPKLKTVHNASKTSSLQPT